MIESKRTLTPDAYEEEVDLRKLFHILWAGKWLIGSIAVAATVVAAIIALMLPNVYRAEALLAPNDQESAGGLSALADQYGGLASLAGINLGDRSTDKTALGLEILKSRKFISEFIERHDSLVPLMAAKRWDAETGELTIDADDYDVAAKKWIRDVRLPKKTTPSLQEAHEEFMEIVSIGHDKNSGFVTVAVEHFSPLIAKDWVDWLIDDLNSTIMHQDVAEAEQSIEYLTKQIENTSLAELQSVFFKLIEEQTKIIMLANVSPEYVFKTIDPAVVPEIRAKPRRVSIAVLTMLFGLLVGAVVVIVRKATSAD